ncbi:hypothetical protein [Streptomyces sp. NPDC091259]|uniref:hypothetical protein n=1 Tax=Streptomyces sp. NPDC091259 TaxID=3365976 RepID=UPI00381104FA
MDELVEWTPGLDKVTVYATYASLGLGTLERAHAGGLAAWDLIVVDEAHRTSGRIGKPWAVIHDNTRIPSLRRLYMTATPRLWQLGNEEEAGAPGELVASMDDDPDGPFRSRCFTLSPLTPRASDTDRPYQPDTLWTPRTRRGHQDTDAVMRRLEILEVLKTADMPVGLSDLSQHPIVTTPQPIGAEVPAAGCVGHEQERLSTRCENDGGSEASEMLVRSRNGRGGSCRPGGGLRWLVVRAARLVRTSAGDRSARRSPLRPTTSHLAR